MVMKRNLIPYSVFIALVSAWLGWTVLVDFFVIRTVFGTITNFFEAGDLGIALFSKLNNLELVVASALLAMLSFQTKKNRNSLKLLIPIMISWIIVMMYFTWLTPKIMTLTELWKAAESSGAIGISGVPDIQQEHQYYHRIYVGLDSLKLFLLASLLSLGIWKSEEWS